MFRTATFSLTLIGSIFLLACEQVVKQNYLFDDPISWHKNEVGDKNSYGYLNLENEQFGQVSYTLSPALSDQRLIPPDFSNIDYYVEENNLDTLANGFFRARFFGYNDTGDLLLYGFRTKTGTYWIKNTEDNTYGITYLSVDIMPASAESGTETNATALNADGIIIHCKELICNNNAGSIGWTVSYEGESEKSTPFAKFQTLNYLIVANYNIFTVDEDVTITNHIESLSIYPPLGVVHKTISQGSLDDGIEIDMVLSETNIDTTNFPTSLSATTLPETKPTNSFYP